MDERTETPQAGPDALDSLLLESGCDFGRPDKRRDRAVRLFNEGCTVAELEDLVRWAHSTRKKLQNVGTYVQWMTADQARWKACVAQLHELQARNAKQVAAEQPAVALPKQPSGEERYAYLRGMAFARVRVDRADQALVAGELGVTVDELMQLVAEEEARRPPVVIKKRVEEPPEPDRLQRIQALRDRIASKQQASLANQEIW